jgi:hypothetical protein
MLALFPPSSLDNSILTSVLVGMLVVWALQETLGWGLSGLVVPGYVATIFLIEPTTAMVVIGEALATWALVTFLSDRVPRWWPWTRLFGRDRFLLFLLVSVAIRLALEAGGFAWLARTTGIEVLRALHSMGLVIVPLAANTIWRSGFSRGLFRLTVTIALTWGIVGGVLLQFMNLSLSSFALTYEDLALDFVSSPRAYILLLVGAAIGSAVNVRWGWDFGGIIIPGLLALCWMEPRRLGATLAEVIVLTMLLRVVLRLPVLRGVNLTGGRPLVLAFGLAYTVKFLLGWVFAGGWIGVSGRDVFGFGYLLTSLLAARAVRYGDLFRVLVPAVTTSFVSFVVASALGLALAVAFPVDDGQEGGPDLVTEAAPTEIEVLEAAWADAGPVPTDVVERVTRGAAVLLAGGDGFGALVVRGGAGPVVTGRVGASQLDVAVLAVAEAVDARAILLCAPRGDACEHARASLADVAPVLVVEPGVASTLSLPADGSATGIDVASIDVGRLGEAVGAFTIDAGAPAFTLTLSPAARLSAGARAFGLLPGPLPDLTSGPTAAKDSAPPLRLGELRVLQESVAAPWMAWRAGGEGAEDSLRLAAGMARRLGLHIGRAGDVSTFTGDGWMAVLDRTGARVLVEAPSLREEPASGSLARLLTRATGATLLLLDRTERGERRPVQGVLLAALTTLGGDAAVLTARTAGAGTDPGAEVVLSVGRPVADVAAAPAVLQEIAALLAAGGVDVATWDGSAQRLPLADLRNESRAAVAVAAGRERQVTVFATHDFVERLHPTLDGLPLAVALGRAGVPSRQVDLARLVTSVIPGDPTAAWSARRTAADDLVRTGAREAVRTLGAGGGSVALLCDPLLGCRWLEAERCVGGACEGFVVPLAPASGVDPGVGTQTALLFGAPELTLRRTSDSEETR